MTVRNIIFLLIASLFLFSSCEEVIEIDLNTSNPQVVIEAQLQEGQHPFTVQISETTDYFDSAPPVFIDNATVVLSDNEGESINIPLSDNGKYEAEVEAVAGKTYSLEVNIDGERYVASSFLPEQVKIMDLEAQFQEENAFLDEGYLVFTRFEDDPDDKNYYRFIHTVNDTLQNGGNDLQVLDDDLFNGGFARVPLFQKIFNTGEVVSVMLYHIDKASYDYYNSLSDIVGEDGPNSGSAAPGNPTTNWSNNALGFFSAYSVDALSIEIP